MDKKSLKIAVEYVWELTHREWDELKLHQKTIENEIENKVNYDPTYMFHVLNNLGPPTLNSLKINDKVRKVKSWVSTKT